MTRAPGNGSNRTPGHLHMLTTPGRRCHVWCSKCVSTIVNNCAPGEVGLGVLLCCNNNAFLAPGVWQCFVALSVLTLRGGLWCWSSGQTCGKTTGCHLSPCLAPGALYIHLHSTYYLAPRILYNGCHLSLLPTLRHTVLYTTLAVSLDPPGHLRMVTGLKGGGPTSTLLLFLQNRRECEISRGGSSCSQLDATDTNTGTEV